MTTQMISANRSADVQNMGAFQAGKSAGKGKNTVVADFNSFFENRPKSEVKAAVKGTETDGKKADICQSEKMTGEKEKLVEKTDVTEKSVPEEKAAVMSEPEDELSQEAVEAVSALMQQMVTLVSEVTGVSEEELGQAMDELGMTVTDFMDGDSLKQLLLKLNGSNDVTDFLTDEQLAQKLQKMMDGVDELVKSQFPEMPKEQLAFAMNRLSGEEEPLEQPVSDGGDTPLPEDGLPDIQVEVEQAASGKEEDHASSGRDTGETKQEAQMTHSQAVNQFVNQLADSVSTGGFENAESVQMMREIVTQVVDQIRITIRQEATSMELQLNPENLGKVNLAVTAKNGQMTATFTVTNETAREALESQMQVLKDTLKEQGLKVEAVEVTVSEFAFEQNKENESNQQSPQKKTQRHFRMDELKESSFEDLTDEEQTAAVRMNVNGSSVDYTA